jgi:hypothetical protein
MTPFCIAWAHDESIDSGRGHTAIQTGFKCVGLAMNCECLELKQVKMIYELQIIRFVELKQVKMMGYNS